MSPTFNNNQDRFCWIEKQQYIKMSVQKFPTTLTYAGKLENCQYNIEMYGCSPIQGKRF